MGETLTWVVATLIIVVVLLISIYVASYLGSLKNKTIQIGSSSDVFAEKSLVSYLMTKGSSGDPVYVQIQNSRNLSDFSGNLAASIFKKLYGNYYKSHIFLGVVDYKKDKENAQINNYFDSGLVARGSSAAYVPVAFYNLIQLKNNLAVRLVLWA